jgi:hypothetical protein
MEKYSNFITSTIISSNIINNITSAEFIDYINYKKILTTNNLNLGTILKYK